MTHLLTENLVPLVQAGRHLPQRPHRSTLRRWAYQGIDGVRLETVKLGGRRYTSLESLQRCVTRLSGDTPDGTAGTA